MNIYNAAEASFNLIDRWSRQTVNKRGGKRKKKSNYNVGQYVRISRAKDTFEQGYEQNFTEELFRIDRISRRQGLFTYILQDLNGEEIDGFFYEQELVPVGTDRATKGIFKIERIVSTKGKGTKKVALVKWKGYPDSFNSYVKFSDVNNI